MNIARLIRHILDQAEYYRLIQNYDQIDVQQYYLFIVERQEYHNQRIPVKMEAEKRCIVQLPLGLISI